MVYIDRILETTLKNALFKDKAIVIYGPRQVGKTTLVQRLLDEQESKKIARYTCDDQRQAKLFEPDIQQLKRVVGDSEIILIDEAQAITNTGLVLKLLVDNFPGVQIIATGSSAFELSDKIKESMAGRVFSFNLLPLALSEVATSQPERATFDIERAMQLGMYPEVFTSDDIDAKKLLTEIVESYLYKDLLQSVTLRNESLLIRLLKALALQVGQEVSFNELATLLEVNRATIERYIYLLEKAFVIFRLDPLSSNPRKVIASRKRKIYFYDMGVRSVLAGQLDVSPLINPSLGGIFENFCIVERMKLQLARDKRVERYYWRSFDSEVDYVEQASGVIRAFEFKWKKSKQRRIPTFEKQFPKSTIVVINSDNFWDFVSF